MLKYFLTFMLILVLMMPSVHAETEPPSISWYEVFVRSFQDSDGDGIGDLNGLIKRLDYIHDLGFDGIWLMPIMPSPSYHKYDVTDYMDVDPEYGNVDDLKHLVSECHARGIRLILDLPLNHSSCFHPWFLEAASALMDGKSDPKVNYYHFSHMSGSTQTLLDGTDWYYEEQFQGGGMPDLNLENPDVMEEIRQIMEFWLVGCDVDGFRLDSVTNFDTGNTSHNIELLNRIHEMGVQLRPDCFMVAEAWTGLSQLAEYYTSDIDCFFLFPASQAEGWIARSMRSRQPAGAYAGYLEDLNRALPGKLLAPFLSNHDTGRTVGSVRGRSQPENVKFAHTLLAMLGGCTFTYYGEEIGMVGSGDDPNKRLAMYWNDQDMTLQPPGVSKLEYAFPCADDQMKDPDSLLSYIRKLNQIKKTWPGLSLGETEAVWNNPYVCVLKKSWGDQIIYVVLNLSASKEQSILIGEKAAVLDSLLLGSSSPSLENGTLILPPYSMAVLSDFSQPLP